ncbi:S-layer homology domain-containing protein [Paenibacillus gansuensis]|uniref:S-layer homology domain-containing protein n=1 Tax=Paenibacillus gansuensis TaxID=306542 RepID=A0ABW5PL61_9BACL
MFHRIRYVCIVILLLSLAVPAGAFAAPPDFSGGVNNEYKYDEMVFLTGEPVVFSGKMTRTEKTAKGITTVSYNFTLTSVDPAKKGKLSRKLSFVTTETVRPDKGQTTTTTGVAKGYKEDIEILGKKFSLADYQFSKSDVVDNRPVSDFYSGNIVGKKTYIVNRGRSDEEELTVTFSGGDIGFKNFWGNTETQVIQQDITAKSWTGSVKSTTSDSTAKKLTYQDNMANYTSFNGGYMRVTDGEMVSRYEYNLPVLKDGVVNASSVDRNIGERALKQSKVPKIERLIVPKFRDTEGHWAQEAIEKLYSLDIFEEKTEIFAPNIPISRYDFTVAVMRAADNRVTDPKTASKTKAPVVNPFRDIRSTDPNLKYMQSAEAKGVVSGVRPSIFEPSGVLTRAQAVTILIRALGFETKAPMTSYSTSFADNASIPYWAKDAVYAANEVGLVVGTSDGTFKPNKEMTRADAAMMLSRFLEFIEKDLKVDYADNIVLY